MLDFLKTVIFLSTLSSLCAFPIQSADGISVSQRFYDTLRPHILTFDIDAHSMGDYSKNELSPTGQDQLLKHIEQLVQDREEIHFICLAFPFKSSNKEHFVDGGLPDMADYHSLEYLQSIIKKLKRIYPKVLLTIMTDGLLFNDLFEIPNAHIMTFENQLKKLINNFPDLKLFTFSQALQEKKISLKDFKNAGTVYKLPKPIPAARFERLKMRVRNEINHKKHTFSKKSSKQQDILLTHLALTLIKRDEYLKKFVQGFQKKNTIRLSIHYQADLSKKVGLKITPHSVVFPWNGVFVIPQNGQGYIIPKSQVDLKIYQKETKTIQGLSLPFYRWRLGVL